MRCIVMIALTIVCFVSPLRAQQGSAYPLPGAGRGDAFPKHVSPTDANPTNWVGQKNEYTDPNGPNSRRYYGHHRYRYYYHHHHYR
jgi:hypothetical protein